MSSSVNQKDDSSSLDQPEVTPSSAGWMSLQYQHGFGNEFETEAVKGALPVGRNNPRLVPFGLYCEQLSGTAFTRPRHVNQRAWLYRQQPSVIANTCGKFLPTHQGFGISNMEETGILDPNPLRWKPFESDNLDTETSKGSWKDKDFVTGTHLLGRSGHPATKSGLGIYIYAFGQNMTDKHMVNSDGDLLLLPQQHSLYITTELGKLSVLPGDIAVIPRGIVFSVATSCSETDITAESSSSPSSSVTRGYMLEIYKGHFVLPNLGPIGSNGLANPRDFEYPVAWYDTTPRPKEHTLVNKFGSQLWTKTLDRSYTPYNVVAWHGNYAPYRYSLSRFCACMSVTYDHLDPSIYTVLTAMGDEEGTALCDFVIFPPRYMATDPNTFRPPWFHRNVMTEFMGLLYGQYDAKSGEGFQPGGASLHSCMTPHGPDTQTYHKAVQDPCDVPTKFEKGLAFMFETNHMLSLTRYALEQASVDQSYSDCWKGLENEFIHS